MSSTTKIYEEKMNNCVAHLDRELTSIRAGRANPGILDKVMVDYYGSPTPVQQVASVAVSEARIDHYPLGWYPDQGNLQSNPDQRYRHQPH